MKLSILLTCVAISLGASPVLAQEEANGAYDDAATLRIESNDLCIEMSASPETHLTDKLSIDAEIRTETVRSPTEDCDRQDRLAQEEVTGATTYPRIGGDVIFRLAYDGTYDAETPRTESNDLFLEMIASPEFQLTRRFSINAEIRLENASPPTEDRYFEDETLFVRKLFLNYDINDRLSIQAGKFTPTFAFASLNIPGMYGNNYSKEIELIERVGFGAEYTFDTGAPGRHTLSASTFFDDTSFLSDSLDLGGRRVRNRLADGGASNTESFESFTVAIEGNAISQLPGFTYRLAYIHEAAGEGDVADENGVLVAAMQSFQLSNGRSLTLVGEIAPLWNFEGTADNIIYASAGVVYQTDPWIIILSGTGRWRDLAPGGTFNDYAIQTSVEYNLGRGTTIAIAHEFTRDENVNGRRIGFRLSIGL